MNLNPQDLNKISLLTLEHYNRHAEEFWDGTRLHDVSQNVESLLQHIEGKPPYSTLAVGLGETSKRSPREAIVQSVWKAPSISSPWREPIAGAKFGGKIFLSSHCRRNISMACSPTLRCFISRGKNCRACYWNCTPL